jgi:hypothetical protein
LEASEEEVPTADDGGEGGVGVKGHGLEEWKCGAVIAGEEVAEELREMVELADAADEGRRDRDAAPMLRG